MSNEHEPDLPLPQPRSPRDLDERILAYARENAPQKSATATGWNRGWMSGLAATGIIGIAVLIALPQQEIVSPAADATLRDESAGLASGEAEELRSVTITLNSPAAVTGARGKATVEEDAAFAAGSGAAEPSAAAADSSLAEKPASAKRAAARRPVAREQPPAPAALQSAMKDEASADYEAVLDSKLQALRDAQTCVEMLESGEDTEAQRCYDRLLEDCGDCSLPPTLEAAAELLPEG